ncbi:MAG: hypothetical protein DMD41_00825 [Gemmatimonadetes bacterium]|nr:MAG: hypothetical protein DMD41_00825 [Gemmatimonadota bacterium]
MARSKTVEELATALKETLGSRLVAFLLYGSTARGTHVTGRSDVNTLLIVDTVDEGLFAAIEPVVSAWSKGGHPAPILLSDAEWRDSADVFAIEYEDMREAHRLLAGRDPWEGGGVTVQRADVRRQLEQELMVKLVRLRQAYAALRNDPKRLAAVISGSMAGFLTMLRTTLRLAGRRPLPPAAPDALVREAAALVGLPPDPLAELFGQARGRTLQLSAADPRAAAYLAAMARVAEFVNRLT